MIFELLNLSKLAIIQDLEAMDQLVSLVLLAYDLHQLKKSSSTSWLHLNSKCLQPRVVTYSLLSWFLCKALCLLPLYKGNSHLKAWIEGHQEPRCRQVALNILTFKLSLVPCKKGYRKTSLSFSHSGYKYWSQNLWFWHCYSHQEEDSQVWYLYERCIYYDNILYLLVFA